MFADDAPEKRDVTKQLFREINEGDYDIFISDAVSLEIGNTPGQKKGRLEALISKFNPVQLPANEKVAELIAAYLEGKVAPTKSTTDIVHIAYTVAHNLDVIVSWNLRHIVRLKTRLAVNGINKLLGYREIEIATPEEVIGYGT